MTFRQKLLRYWLAMTSSCVQATAHSFKAWLAVAAMHATSDSIPALDWRQTLGVIGFFWLLSVVDYLQANPLPEFDTAFFLKPQPFGISEELKPILGETTLRPATSDKKDVVSTNT